MINEKRREVLLILCLCVGVAVPFLPVLRAEITGWDDILNVTENPYLRKGVTDGLFHFFRGSYLALYIPITYSVYWLEFKLWGVNPLGFHLSNLLVHLASVVLVYLLFRRLLKACVPAVVAALWWGVHPLNVEPVAWITGLKDILSAFLMLISLLLYVVWREKKGEAFQNKEQGWLFFGGSLGAFVLACLSKPGAVALPLALVGYDLFLGKRSWRAVAATMPYFAFSLLIVLLTKSAQKAEEWGVMAPDFLGRVRVVGDSLLFYVAKLAWPAGLCAIYTKPVEAVVNSPGSWVRLAGAIALFGGALLVGRRWRFGVMIFIAGIIPVAGLIPFGYQRFSTVADRYVYFSGLGLALILGDVVSRFNGDFLKDSRRWGIAAVSGLVVWSSLLGMLTWQQTHVWRNSLALWEHAVEKQPNSAASRNNRGAAWGERGDFDKEIADCTRAIELKPDYPEAYNNLGAALGKKGKYGDAIEKCGRAIELKQDYVEAWNNRGGIFVMTGQYDEAIRDCTRALKLRTGYAEAYHNRAGAWAGKGEYEKAIEDYGRAIEFRPNYPNAYSNRGLVWHKKGDLDGAIRDQNHAIELDPHDVNAYYRRGIVWYEKGETDRAIDDLTSAIQLDPDNADIYKTYCNRGAAWGRKGNLDQLIEDCTRAAELRPDYIEAYINRSKAWSAKGQYDRVIEDCTRIIELNPNHIEAYLDRSNAWSAEENYDKAIADCTHVIQLSPDNVEAYRNRADSWSAKGEHERAIEDYTRAVELNPDFFEAYNNRAVTYYLIGQYDHAWADIKRCRELGGEVNPEFVEELKKDSGRAE